MEKSTSSSQRKHVDSDEDDSTNKNSSNHNVIDKSTINPFTNDDVQPTTSKSTLDDSAIKPFVEHMILPPLQSENSLEKNKSKPFRYCTPDCKGAHKKILPQKSIKGKKTSEEISSKMKLPPDNFRREMKYFSDESTDSYSDPYSAAFSDDYSISEIEAIMASFDRKVDIYCTGSPESYSTDKNPFLDSFDEENIIDDRNIAVGTSEKCGAGISDMMDRFNKEEDNYEAEITYADILAASVLQQSRLKRRESDTE